jgi:hypothetical protein
MPMTRMKIFGLAVLLPFAKSAAFRMSNPKQMVF